ARRSNAVAAESIAWKVSTWLATYALHSTVLIAASWVAAILLSRVGRWRDLAAGLREWMWKLALLGGLATATAQAGFSIQTWRLDWFPTRHEQKVVVADATTQVIAPAIWQLQTLELAPAESPVEFRAVPAITEVSAPPSTPVRIPWIQIVLSL